MSFFSKLRGTIESVFQIGLGGPLWKNNATALDARNSADSNFVNVRVLSPVGPDDAITKAYADALFPGASPQYYLQSVFKEITVDTTTTSASFITLLSQAITTLAGSGLIVHFTVGADLTTSAAVMDYQLVIDGVARRAVSQRCIATGATGSVAIVYKLSGLGAGVHTVEIKYRTSGGTLSILPVTKPNQEHASLLIEEVTA